MTFQLLFLAAPLLPVAVAQGLCIRYDWLKRLRKPLDFGLTFRNRRVFGENKTWRGLVVNVVFCTLGTMVQAALQSRGRIPPWLPLLDYTRYGMASGVLIGLGMTLGELPNSFLKRQLEISPGKKKGGVLGAAFFLFDQVDLAVGIWVFLLFLVRPPLILVLWSFLLTLVLHVSVSSVGYLLGMRKTVF